MTSRSELSGTGSCSSAPISQLRPLPCFKMQPETSTAGLTFAVRGCGPNFQLEPLLSLPWPEPHLSLSQRPLEVAGPRDDFAGVARAVPISLGAITTARAPVAARWLSKAAATARAISYGGACPTTGWLPAGEPLWPTDVRSWRKRPYRCSEALRVLSASPSFA
jgi:hypothetical protein